MCIHKQYILVCMFLNFIYMASHYVSIFFCNFIFNIMLLRFIYADT